MDLVPLVDGIEFGYKLHFSLSFPLEIAAALERSVENHSRTRQPSWRALP